MSALAGSPSRSAPPPLEPVFAAAAMLLAIGLGIALMLIVVDPRLVNGENAWIKPAKFALALMVYTGTLAFYARWLPPRLRASRWHAVFVAIVVLCIAAEMVWIVAAAAFGTRSHFNTDPVWSALYPVMGLLAVILTSAAAVYGIAIWRNRGNGLNRPLRTGLGLGLTLTFVLTVIVAGRMAEMGSHGVGGEGPVREVWPIVRFATDRGDLRAAHFLATHAMHVIPAGALVLSLGMAEPAARRATFALALVYAVFVIYALMEALAGRAFLSTLA